MDQRSRREEEAGINTSCTLRPVLQTRIDPERETVWFPIGDKEVRLCVFV